MREYGNSLNATVRFVGIRSKVGPVQTGEVNRSAWYPVCDVVEDIVREEVLETMDIENEKLVWGSSFMNEGK